mmetsp:Transcript_16125/g.43855  ORF Transcript_16125/g.43855 Transcript_16125/m.43855 type:complete len:257 (-) Transcript_16125:111-881(-)
MAFKVANEQIQPVKVFQMCLGEFIGTFFLVFVVGCNVLTGSVGAALSIGVILMAMVYAIGPVSGAHLNPAVSASLMVAGVFGGTPAPFAPLFAVVQLFAGAMAALSFYLLIGESFPLQPVGRFHWSVAGSLELIYTAALCYVVLNVATLKSKANNHYFGLAIGMTVTSAAISIGGISGCALNPAVAFAVCIARWTHTTTFVNAFAYLPLYWGAQFLGSGLAVGMFLVVNDHELQKRRPTAKRVVSKPAPAGNTTLV